MSTLQGRRSLHPSDEDLSPGTPTLMVAPAQVFSPWFRQSLEMLYTEHPCSSI
jgi:hypothetical protein